MSILQIPNLAQISWSIRSGSDIKGFDTINGLNPKYPPYDYQLRGIAWMAFTPRAILADGTGLGKSISALGLIQVLKNRKEPYRTLLIVPAANVHGTWVKDGFQKFVPKMKFGVAAGLPKKKRLDVYANRDWEVLITTYDLLWRDIDTLLEIPFDIMICDEADILRNSTNKSHKAARKIAAHIARVYLMTATPYNNKLKDLHGLLSVLGLQHVFGNAKEFDKRYVKYVFDDIWIGGRKRKIPKIAGYKNLEDFKQRLAPYYLRRRAQDINVGSMPALLSQTRWFDLYPEQANLYRKILDSTTNLDTASRMDIENTLLRLRQVCTTTALIDPSIDKSVKFDFLVNQLKGDWFDEKIVLFCNWRAALECLEKRFEEHDIGYVKVVSGVPHEQREEHRQKFWKDKKCQVFMGTTAIEKGLNLQVARIQVNMDMLYNPQRHTQLAGRVHRTGSEHSEAMIFSLLSRYTVEQRMLTVLEEKQAMSDYLLDDSSKLFRQLTTSELRSLIKG